MSFKFLFWGQPYQFRDISQTSKLKSTTETFSATRDLFVLMDAAIICIQSRNNHNCCIPDQEHVGHYINTSTETGLDFFIKHLLRLFNADFAAAKVVVVAIVVVVEAVVVAVVVVIVLVAVVEE